jgi:glutathionyl-hydroquinone reductase
MSSLLDNLASPDYRPPRGPECGMALVLAAVDDKTRKTLLAALDNPYAPSTKIAQALAELGHRTSVHVVQRHRRGECRCHG